MMKIKASCIILLIIGILFPAMVFGEKNDAISLEDKIKAVCIYNFTKYIEWVDDDTTDSFEIGIIGDSDIIFLLQEIAKKELVDNRKIEVIHFQDINDINNCHILFISASENNSLSDILQKVKDNNILTVSDSMGFAQEGVGINFIIVDKKIKFEINNSAIDQAGLHVSSQLLKLAILVEEKEKSND